MNAMNGPAIVMQIAETPFLSEWFGISMGTIFIAVEKESILRIHESTIQSLIDEAVNHARKQKIAFVSVSIPSFAMKISKAFESRGFYLSEAFVNLSGPALHKRQKVRTRVKIQDMNEGNAKKYQACIKRAYIGETFPNRFAAEKQIGREKAMALYSNRFEQVFEKNIGNVMVATVKGEFAGAIIYAIDKELKANTGITTNLQSGLGIIIPKKFRRMGIASKLIAQRQKRYKKAGADHVSFGASINNYPMITGLEALGLAMTSSDLIFSKWVDQ